VNIYLKLLSAEAFSAQNAPNSVWRSGSARTRWGAYSALQTPSWIKKSLLPREGWEGSGGWVKRRREGEGRG